MISGRDKTVCCSFIGKSYTHTVDVLAVALLVKERTSSDTKRNIVGETAVKNGLIVAVCKKSHILNVDVVIMQLVFRFSQVY